MPGAPAAPAGGGDAAALAALRGLMRDVDALKAERDALEAELKDATVDLRAEFLAALAADGCVDEPALSAGALGAALAPLQRRARESLARQEALLARVQEAHEELTRARGGASGRDEALGRVAAAYDAFRDLTGNLREGVKFYNDLTQLLVAFQNKVSDFCFARKTEKEELMKDLTQEAARPAQRPAPAPPQHHADAAVDEVSGPTSATSLVRPLRPLIVSCRFQPAAVRKEAPPRPPPPSVSAPSASALPYPTQAQGESRRREPPYTEARRFDLTSPSVRRHAAAVRRARGPVPVLRGADAGAVQPVRHAAVPAPRAAHAAGAALPGLPVPAAAAGRLPAAAARRLQPLRAAPVDPLRAGGRATPLYVTPFSISTIVSHPGFSKFIITRPNLLRRFGLYFYL